MGNNLLSMINGINGANNTNGAHCGNNPLQLMQSFQKFRAQFPPSANPQQIIDKMVQSGKVSQNQIDQAVQMAKSMGLIK